MHFRICEMIATSGFLIALECIKFVFGSLGPHWGSLQCSPRHTRWFKGDPTSKGKQRGKGNGPPNANSWIHPWQVTLLRTPASSCYLNVLVAVSKNVSAVVELYSNERLRFLLGCSWSS